MSNPNDATPTQQALSNELDETLLAAVRKQRDADEPNAAILNAAIARLKALGITHMVQPGDAAARMAEELGLGDTIKFPPLDDAPDAATGTM